MNCLKRDAWTPSAYIGQAGLTIFSVCNKQIGWLLWLYMPVMKPQQSYDTDIILTYTIKHVCHGVQKSAVILTVCNCCWQSPTALTLCICLNIGIGLGNINLICFADSFAFANSKNVVIAWKSFSPGTTTLSLVVDWYSIQSVSEVAGSDRIRFRLDYLVPP